MIDYHKSAEIFNHLMNGRVINREVMGSHGAFENNHLFSEIMDHREDYSHQYKMSGFHLVENVDYFYIIKGQEFDIAKTQIAMKAYFLLTILSKYATSNNISISKLWSADGGISQAELVKIEELRDTKEILERCNLDDSLFKNIKVIMVDRDIAYIHPVSQNIVLANAGKQFFEDIKNDFEFHNQQEQDELKT